MNNKNYIEMTLDEKCHKGYKEVSDFSVDCAIADYCKGLTVGTIGLGIKPMDWILNTNPWVRIKIIEEETFPEEYIRRYCILPRFFIDPEREKEMENE